MSERVHLLQRKASRVRAAQGELHRPPQESSGQALAVQRLLSTPTRAQGQAVRPVLRAATLQRQEEARLSGTREVVQRQVAALSGAPGVQREVRAPVTARPVTPSDWVTVMRARAEGVDGQRLDIRAFSEFQTLQRQVAQSLGQGFRTDRGDPAARYATYGEHLATLQRHALSAPVSRVVLGLVPSAERLPLQRATDEALQRMQAQDRAALNFDTLASLQRQLAELDAEATQPVLQRIQARRGAGNPLPEAIQRHLEQGLNHDLSRVRIHDDAEADKLAKGVNALAFTTGTDIFFRAGRFNPNTQTGLALLAHEVTHTVQQSQGRVGRGIDPDAGLESEARDMGTRLSRTLPRSSGSAPARPLTSLSRTTPNVVQRKSAAPATASKWRQSGKLRGHPPVRDEANPPNPNVVEDEQKYRVLLAGARQLLTGQRQRAATMLKPDRTGVRDYRYWFARVYSHVTENEILFAEQKTYDYPSYVMQCVLYFDKLYADNLTAIKTKVEPHWKASFDTAQRMQGANQVTQLPNSVFSLVSAMLAHIRFDLPRAESWVAQSYQKAYGAKPSDFRADFFRMSGVFDNASRSMFADMKKLLPDKVGGAAKAIDAMSYLNWTSGAMRHLLGADMSAERLETWRRMEMMVAQGKVPPNPYTLRDGRLVGNVAGNVPGQNIAPLSQIQPERMRPSMEGINATWGNRIVRGAEGAIGSQLDTFESQVAQWQKTFNNPAAAAKTSVYDRAEILLTLIKNPAIRIQPMPVPVIGALPVASGKDDVLIVSILKASFAKGDLHLLVNMVDAQTLISTLEDKNQRLRAETMLINGNYYETLGVMNATNQIEKWYEAGDNDLNRRSAQRIYASLPDSVKEQVSTLLKRKNVPAAMYR
ncbi:eCIS core domain-containing protein [Deinococcus kurensis]|uniref:eCIS core domain-containing protein n=1 Tax=Deinococcus kurensis TaxID=2662757 RepID=UPI0012D34745|nr:DUF4157 domain-containing protein [Deinococcus kurensis]